MGQVHFMAIERSQDVNLVMEEGEQVELAGQPESRSFRSRLATDRAG